MYSPSGMINRPNPFTSPPPSFSVYNHQDLTTSGLLFPVHEVTALENNSITLYEFANQLNSDASTINSLPPRERKPSHKFRKEKHSKIVTAQGPRDRRVRLSIQVARKFFDLHDTLGLDKASETLNWLLTKSQSAIDDLVKNKHKSCSTTILEDQGCSRSNSTLTEDRRISMQQEEKAKISSLLARESRSKARARARERTRQKMSIRHLFETNNKLLPVDFRISANYKSMVPYFNVGTDQVGQSTIRDLCPKTNWQTDVRLCEAYNKKFKTQHNN